MPDPSCGSNSNIGVAVETTHTDQVSPRERAQEAFTGLIEPVGARLPFGYQLLYETKAFVGSFVPKLANLRRKCL